MKTEKEKREILSAEDEKLSLLCGSLKQVEAPKDFDFKVRARLADQKTRAAAPRFGYALRYALPAFALILMLGLFAYTSGVFSSSDNNPMVASGEAPPNVPSTVQATPALSFTPAEKPLTANANVATLAPETPKAPEKIQNQQVAENARQARKIDAPNRKQDTGIRSKDIAFTEYKPLQPKNGSSLILPQNTANEESSKGVAVKEILSANGIEVELENGQWKVKSVAAKSAAESSGVKTNDVLEAIDDEPLSGGASLNKATGGKTLTVSRDGKKIVVKLPNK